MASRRLAIFQTYCLPAAFFLEEKALTAQKAGVSTNLAVNMIDNALKFEYASVTDGPDIRRSLVCP